MVYLQVKLCDPHLSTLEVRFSRRDALKKSTLDKDQVSNDPTISNVSLISKIIEHIVRYRLTGHPSSNNLLNPHHSAYCKHHSTQTALSYIHDHLINAIGLQKNSIYLLDLSAAFDTIDHNILTAGLNQDDDHRPLVCHLGSGFMALFLPV